MGGEEFLDFLAEWEAAHAHVIRLNATALEDVERFEHRAVAAAERHDANVVRALACERSFRHELLRRVELPFQAIEHDLIVSRVLGVSAVLRVTGAAREIRALRMHAGQRAIRDRIAVLVEVAVELVELLDLLLAQQLAAIGTGGGLPIDRPSPS